ncbi:MAG: chemotaxis protein CheW [Cyanobacteria bacterium P01_F01_bin.53]
MTQLMLIFRLGSERYALATSSIIEIIPRVALSRVHDAKKAATVSSAVSSDSSPMAGRFNYHGQVVPVLDLSQILRGTPSRPALGTRIILVALSKDPSAPDLNAPDLNAQHLMGFLVEQVTETLEGSEFSPAVEDHDVSRPSYLSKTLMYQQSIIQCVCLDQLVRTLTEDGVLDSPLPVAVTAG